MTNLFPWWKRYPNVNDEILNLDWLLYTVKKLGEEVSDFINLNTIKYADPILWDITSQYEANTIVVDPQTGDAYISTQAVPYGVTLSNSSYWTKIYNYADAINGLQEQIAAANERLSTTASASRAAGDLVWLNGVLYIVTSSMNAGDSYVEGSNCYKITIEEILGNLLSLNTSDKASLVNAINEVLIDVGALSSLNTSDKTSTVNAINEVLTDIGDLNTLDTLDQTSIVNAINEVFAYTNTSIINVLFPPDNLEALDNTATSDNSTKLQALVDYAKTHNYKTIFFPSGSYRFDSTINIDFNFLSFVGANEGSSNLICYTSNINLFNIYGVSGSPIQHVDFKNLTISAADGISSVTGLNYSFVNQFRVHECKFHSLAYHVFMTTCGTPIISNCTFYMNFNTAQNVVMIRVAGSSPSVLINKCRMTLSSITGDSYGIQDTSAADLIVSECTIGGGQYGVACSNPNSMTVVGDLKIIDNEFDRQTISSVVLSGIRNTSDHLYDSSCLITNNYLYVNADHSDNLTGVISIRSCIGTIIANNTIFNPMQHEITGICINGSQLVTIEGNHIHNAYNAIKAVSDTSISILNNIISNPSFAANIDITIAGCTVVMINENISKGTKTHSMSVSASSSKGQINNNLVEGDIINNSGTITELNTLAI